MVGIQPPAAMREEALVALAVRTEMIITKAYETIRGGSFGDGTFTRMLREERHNA